MRMCTRPVPLFFALSISPPLTMHVGPARAQKLFLFSSPFPPPPLPMQDPAPHVVPCAARSRALGKHQVEAPALMLAPREDTCIVISQV